MFRYERPQKGRYRQFVQLDIEALGAQDAYVDLEVIDFSMELYRRLGLSNLQVVLNCRLSEVPPCLQKRSRSSLRAGSTSSATHARDAMTGTLSGSWTAKVPYAKR